MTRRKRNNKFKFKFFSLFICIIIIVVLYIIDEKYNNYVVKVDDQRISAKEYSIYLKLAKADIEDNYALNYGEDYKKDVWSTTISDMTAEQYAKEQAYNQVVRNKVCDEKAEEIGIKLSEKEKQEIISQINETSLSKDISRKGLTNDEYFEVMCSQKIIDKLKERLLVSVNVTSEEINDYIAENKDTTMYIVQRIIFKTKDENTLDEITPSEKKKVYEKATEALERLNNNENFTSISLEYSDYDKDYKPGEKYEFILGQTDNTKLEEVASNLKKGEISTIFETSYGYEIIKLESIVDSSSKDFKNKIKETLLEIKRQNIFEEEYKKWENTCVIELNKSVYSSITI